MPILLFSGYDHDKKHSKPRKGYKTEDSSANLDQHAS